jgi:thiol-disulfide isomerase/thioredoxin
MKMSVIFMSILIYTPSLLAQSSAKIKTTQLNIHRNDSAKAIEPLTIGDHVPDIVFKKVLNYKSLKARLSDFKGKLVILDMWSVYCTSCIAGFPKMEKLQQKYGDKIQILLVNPHDAKYDSEEKINYTLNRLKARTGYYPALPIPIHDSILNKYFPHQEVPHQVWIGGNGKVLAITGSNQVTETNIASILNGNIPDFKIKNDFLFDNKLPLLVEGNGGNPDDFLFRSIFTKYKDGIGFRSGTRINSNGDIIGMYILNYSLGNLVMMAYSDLADGFNSNRIFFEINNQPDQFNNISDTSNAYCYDLIIPATPAHNLNLKKILQEDLKRFFNLTAHISTRKLKCLKIVETDRIGNSKHQSEIDMEKESINKFIHNFSVSEIIKILDGCSDIPMIDETGISDRYIDIDFPKGMELNDLSAILKVLGKAGFSITEEERELKVIIVTDK